MSRRKQQKFSAFGLVWRGATMGIAEAVPGVSGATVAFITGLYATLVAYIDEWTNWVLALIRTRALAPLPCIPFALTLGAGMAAGLILTALAMATLIENWKSATLLGVAVLVLVAMIPTTIEVARQSRLWQVLLLISAGAAAGYLVTALTADPLPATGLWLVAAGIAASTALVLPGISGSFILLILGLYQPTLMAVRAFDYGFLALLGCGVILGVLMTARIMNRLMRKAPYATTSLCCGLVYGALPNIVPQQPLASLAVQDFAGIGAGLVVGAILIGASRSA